MLDLFVQPGATAGQRETVLMRWQREQLKALVPPLLAVEVSGWGIRKMKTK